ncbi:MAG: twin-arginine translocation signal domain-containing protein [Donghicola eburneus]|nr:twin-arginine translocation signal domain-containing protein [Donghicola eburneus]MCI5040037.1 twin-arginine translocation signal domain-containing protein [Donghicola eburneus]
MKLSRRGFLQAGLAATAVAAIPGYAREVVAADWRRIEIIGKRVVLNDTLVMPKGLPALIQNSHFIAGPDFPEGKPMLDLRASHSCVIDCTFDFRPRSAISLKGSSYDCFSVHDEQQEVAEALREGYGG